MKRFFAHATQIIIDTLIQGVAIVAVIMVPLGMWKTVELVMKWMK